MADQEPHDGELVKLTGLWTGKSSKVGGYLSGTLSPSSRLIIFKNKHKKPGGKQPDYIAYIAANRPKEEGASNELEDLQER